MTEIRAGQIVLFYLFDVAETVDLPAVSQLTGGVPVAARLAPKQATPAYVQYEKPPLSFDGETVGIGDVEGFRPRVRLYDYGWCRLRSRGRSAAAGAIWSGSVRT